MSTNNDLDFTRKNIPKIVELMEKDELTDEDFHKIAENTSKIVGMPVKWMESCESSEKKGKKKQSKLSQFRENT